MTTQTKPIQRMGNAEKCPVCGSRVDSEAYCCPTCRSIFCYHCRAPVLRTDPQFQCLNKGCDYHGRLVCGACDPGHEREEAPSVYREPEDGFWLLLLALSLIGGVVGWIRWRLDWGGALTLAVVVFIVLSLVVRVFKRSVFGRTIEVEQRRRSNYHTCISCGEEVRSLVEKA